MAHSFGWSLNWDAYQVSASGLPPSVVTVNRPGNKKYQFTLQGGVWKSDADITDKLERLVDASNFTTGWRYTTADGDVETYAIGTIASITNRVGWSWTYTRAGSNYTVTDPFGRKLVFGFDAQNNRTATDPAGGIYTYRNDANNNLASVIYPDGKVRKYVYEDSRYPNALTGIIDENGARYATWIYDAQGRAIISEHAGGAEKVTLDYNTNGSTIVADALGTPRTRNFMTVLGVIKGAGQSQRGGSGCAAAVNDVTYDANGNISTRTDFNGNLTTYSYDLSRNLETQRVEASGKPEARTISTAWHPDWRLATRIAEPLKLTTLVYNGQPDPSNGNAAASCAPATTLVNGKPIAVLCKKLEQATTDTAGAAGFNATVSGTPRIWSYTYNQYGQVLSIDGPRTDVADLTTYTYYDATDPDLGKRGNLASVTDALGHTTQYTAYDAHGRLLSITDPNGLVTTNIYDVRQRLTSRTVGTETTRLQYDGVGQVTQLTLPDSSTLSYTYDAAHRLTDVQDSAGNRLHYTLDAMGNRIQEHLQDPSGQLAKTLSRSYDALNRLQTLTGVGQE